MGGSQPDYGREWAVRKFATCKLRQKSGANNYNRGMNTAPRPSAPLLLWLIALLSLAINLALLAAIAAGVMAVRGIARESADQLQALAEGSLETPVHVNQSIPISLTVPFSYETEIAIAQNVPIKTTVSFKQEIPLLGEIPINVPIDLSIPVNMKVPISIKRDIPISTVVPVQLDVIATTRFAGTVMQTRLNALAAVLRRLGGG